MSKNIQSQTDSLILIHSNIIIYSFSWVFFLSFPFLFLVVADKSTWVFVYELLV